MDKICPNCGTENDTISDYCYKCDSYLGDTPDEVGNETSADSATLIAIENELLLQPDIEAPGQPQIDKVATPHKTKPKNRKWLWYTLGCAGLLLICIVGMTLIHLFVLRPVIQREVFERVEKGVRDSFEIEAYQGRLMNSTIQQEELEAQMDEIWDQIPGLKAGEIEFQQDNVRLMATIYGIRFQIETDIRCDSEGNLLIKSIQTNRAIRFLFAERDLEEFIVELVNDELIDQADIALKALQVTEEEIFLVYEPR